MAVRIGHTPIYRATLAQRNAKPDISGEYNFFTKQGIESVIGASRTRVGLKDELNWVLDRLNDIHADVVGKMQVSIKKYDNYIGSEEYMFMQELKTKIKRLL